MNQPSSRIQPPSNLTSSENKIRLTAFLVLVLVLAYLITGNPWLFILLIVDFSLRATSEMALLSPLAAISGLITRILSMPVKPVYMPPKRFAARIGMLFCLGLLFAHNSQLGTLLLGATIALFAALESLAGFCAGCWVYNAFMRLRSR